MTPESLLRAHQDGVYTVCMHILKHPQDAEDAAQEVLIKVAAEAGNLREPRAFKSWLYRITFRTAVDHLRRRQTRRRIEEGSAPMTPSLTDAQREAIHEAMAALPDDDRLVLVEHYFEETTLEEMGRREGISDVAMGKRLEKSREKLRRGLAGAGFALAMTQITQSLEAVESAAAPAGLMNASLAVAGTKSATIAGLVTILMLALAAGGGIYLVRRSTADTTKAAGRTESTASIPDPHVSGVEKVASTEKNRAAACRALVARTLPFLRANDMLQFAWVYACGSEPQAPEIRDFIRDFTASAGDDLVPIVNELLSEPRSDSLRFLLIVALGRSGDERALPLLKELSSDSNTHIAAAAIQSAGRIRSAESLEHLRSLVERTRNAPLAMAVLVAIGLQGTDGLNVLLAEARKSTTDTVANYQGVPWSVSFSKSDCLALARGSDVFDALKRILETEDDASIREGVVSAMAMNLKPAEIGYLAQIVSSTRSPHLKREVMYSLVKAAGEESLQESAGRVRTELVDRILTEATYPSGDPQMDRALIHLASIASPDKADPLYWKFLALYSQSPSIELSFSLGEIAAAFAMRPDAASRISALMDSMQLTDPQRGFVTLVVLQKAPPQVAEVLLKPIVDIVRNSHPKELRFENGLSALVRGGKDERVLSAVIQEVYDKHPEPQDRQVLFRQLSRYGERSGQVAIPRTFYEGLLRTSEDAEGLMLAAKGLFATPAGIDSDRETQRRMAEWIGPDMKWATSLSEEGTLTDSAPDVIGDYYSRYGTAKDIAWLKTLPETFPYPKEWDERELRSLKSSLLEESRRAIDAIRLRN